VKAFAREKGNQVIAISRNVERLEKLKATCDALNSTSQVYTIPFDLETGDFDIILRPFVKNLIGNIDILVNNAGLLINKPFQNLTSNDFDRTFSVNVKSVFLLTQSLLPLLKQGSHVINISSMGGFQGSAKFNGLSLYSSSKGALGILTECMAEEFQDLQIKVNALALGAVQTEMLADAFPGYRAPLSSSEMATFIKQFALTGHHVMNGKIIPVSISTP